MGSSVWRRKIMRSDQTMGEVQDHENNVMLILYRPDRGRLSRIRRIIRILQYISWGFYRCVCLLAKRVLWIEREDGSMG